MIRITANMTLEQRRILESKPIEQMRRFGSLLHWRDLRLERDLFTPEQIAEYNIHASGIIAYYMTTEDRFNLQINELKDQPPFTHQATIKAERYGICNTRWSPFTLFNDIEALEKEAERLRPILDRRLYRNAKWRREFKRKHPEFLLGSRKRRRGHA